MSEARAAAEKDDITEELVYAGEAAGGVGSNDALFEGALAKYETYRERLRESGELTESLLEAVK